MHDILRYPPPINRMRTSFRNFARATMEAAPGKIFISDGTLLGLVRGNDLIDGDMDIDFGIFQEDLNSHIVEHLRTSGFILLRGDGEVDDGFHLKFSDGITRIDLTVYYREADRCWMAGYYKRSRSRQFRYYHELFELEMVNYLGVETCAPVNPEKYLAAQYGPDWQTPNSNWESMFSPLNGVAYGSWRWKMKFVGKQLTAKIGKLFRPRNVMPPITQPKSDDFLPGNGVVLADGTFDMLHSNHIEFFRQVKSFGDYLIVGVISDDNVAKYKRKPILNQEERLKMVSSLKIVDEVFIIDDPLVAQTCETIIQTYRPEKFAYSGEGWEDYYKPAIDRGIFLQLKYQEGINSSEIIERVRK